MDIICQLQGVEFAWDEEKARSNIADRGETDVVSLAIPQDTLVSLRQVAAQREMSEQALLKFYIGQGLRQDLTRLFGDRVLTITAHVLARHFQSDEAVAAIMREIREEVVR